MKGIPSAPPYNWTFYRELYPELHGLTTQQAQQHYFDVGADEGRLAAPPTLKVVYATSGGLCNQLYHHLHAFMMARALAAGGALPASAAGTAIVLPPALHRRSFGDSPYGRGPAERAAAWRQAPIGTLLDVGSMQAYWAARGLELLPTPDIVPRNPFVSDWLGRRRAGMSQPQRLAHNHTQQAQQQKKAEQAQQEMYRTDWLSYRAGGRCLAASVAEQLQKDQRAMSRMLAPLHRYTRGARDAILTAAKPVLIGDPGNQIPCVYLWHGGTLFALNTSGLRGVAAEAARGVFFNRTIVALADQILAAMDPGSRGFNGLHLRLEKDVAAWHQGAGGMEGALQSFLDGMKAAKFADRSTLYVASGMLSYNASREWLTIETKIEALGLAEQIAYKERFLRASQLAGLHSEQLALIDFLVLLKSQRLCGLAESSFSYLLVEMRALQGRPKSTAVLINPGSSARTLFRFGGQLSN
ncbi:hypothetical protein N2152v2_002149 [Parachlorella kessleri]